MSTVLDSIRSEFRRYRGLSERAMDQMSDDELRAGGPGGASSIATIAWHMGANLRSRFTDFLTSDGEKPWRKREEEFARRDVVRTELMDVWNRGWECLESAIEALGDEDLGRTIRIRHQPLTVADALHRALAHAAYHTGQIVYIARSTRGDDWEWLSIPPGGTDAFNRTMAERFAKEAD